MNPQCRRPRGDRGGGAQGVIIFLAIVALAVVFFITRKSGPPETKPPEMAVRTAEEITPLTSEPSTPPPKASATPTPAPAVVETPSTPPPVVEAKSPPAPTPPPLDLATVAVSPTLWPTQVALLQPFSFPVLLNGRLVGQAKAPVGTLLRLVRINGQQVEIEFQNVRHSIPAASTDLLQRALVKLQTGDAAPTPNPQPVTAMLPPALTASTQASRTATEPDPVRLGQRIGVDVSPVRGTRIEGGDFDDKKDRFRLKVKFINQDTVMSAEGLTGEIYVFGEDLKDRSIRKVLAFHSFTFSLPVRGTHEETTKEVVTAYDDTNYARFGVKYESWFLRIRNRDGKLVLMKSNSPTVMKLADKITGLKVDANYDRKTFAPSTSSR